MTEKNPIISETELEKTLSVQEKEPVGFPPDKEAEMMAFIAHRAEEIRTVSPKTIGFPIWKQVARVAAAVLVICGIGQIWRSIEHRSDVGLVQLEKKRLELKSPGPDPVDINHDGRVDVIDAYLLAVELESGQALSLERDVNRDGKINRLDVQYITARAVDLKMEKS